MWHNLQLHLVIGRQELHNCQPVGRGLTPQEAQMVASPDRSRQLSELLRGIETEQQKG
jgi:hypothetical protein